MGGRSSLDPPQVWKIKLHNGTSLFFFLLAKRVETQEEEEGRKATCKQAVGYT